MKSINPEDNKIQNFGINDLKKKNVTLFSKKCTVFFWNIASFYLKIISVICVKYFSCENLPKSQKFVENSICHLQGNILFLFCGSRPLKFVVDRGHNIFEVKQRLFAARGCHNRCGQRTHHLKYHRRLLVSLLIFHQLWLKSFGFIIMILKSVINV